MAIEVSNNQRIIEISPQRIMGRARHILNALEYPDAELSLSLVDDETIAGLNKQYFGRQGPTNVISFPMHDGDPTGPNPDLLGDVVISAETTASDAVKNGYSAQEMLDFYLIHGILHLIGYDHEGSAEEAARMEAKSEEVWLMLGHNR